MPQSPQEIWQPLLSQKGVSIDLTGSLAVVHSRLSSSLPETLTVEEIYTLAKEALQRTYSKADYAQVLCFLVFAHCSAILKTPSIIQQVVAFYHDLTHDVLDKELFQELLGFVLEDFPNQKSSTIEQVVSSPYYQRLLNWEQTSRSNQQLPEVTVQPSAGPQVQQAPPTESSDNQIDEPLLQNQKGQSPPKAEKVDPERVKNRQIEEFEFNEARGKHAFYSARLVDIPQSLPEWLIAEWIVILLESKHPNLQKNVKKPSGPPLSLVHFENRLTSSLNSEHRDLIKQASELNSIGNIEKAIGKLEVLWKSVLILDVRQIEQVAQQNRVAASHIDGQDVILLIGMTGVGKTLLITKLLGYELVEGQIRGMSTFLTKDPLRPEHTGLESGPQQKSITRHVSAYPVDIDNQPLLLLDSPGFEDSESHAVDIGNSITSVECYRRAKTARIVVVLSERSWGDRGQKILALSRVVCGLINAFYVPNILFCFSKFDPAQLSTVPSKIKEIIDAQQLSKGQTSFFKSMKAQIEKPKCNWNILTMNPSQVIKVIVSQPSIKKPKDEFRVSIVNAHAIVKRAVLEWKAQFQYYIEARKYIEAKYYFGLVSDFLRCFQEVGSNFQVAGEPQKLESIVAAHRKGLVEKKFQIISLGLTQPEIVFQATLNEVKSLELYKEKVEATFHSLPPLADQSDATAELVRKAIEAIKDFRWPHNLRSYIGNLSSIVPNAKSKATEAFGSICTELKQKLILFRDRANRCSTMKQLEMYLTAATELEGTCQLKTSELLSEFQKVVSKGDKVIEPLEIEETDRLLAPNQIIRVEINSTLIEALEKQYEFLEFIGTSEHTQFMELSNKKIKRIKNVCSRVIRKSCTFVNQIWNKTEEFEPKTSRKVKSLLEQAGCLAEANFISPDDRESLKKTSTILGEYILKSLGKLRTNMRQLRISVETVSEVAEIQKNFRIVKNLQGFCELEDRKEIASIKAEIVAGLSRVLEGIRIRPFNVFSRGPIVLSTLQISIATALQSLALIGTIDPTIFDDDSLSLEVITERQTKAVKFLLEPFKALNLDKKNTAEEQNQEHYGHRQQLRSCSRLLTFVEQLQKMQSDYQIPSEIEKAIDLFENYLNNYCEKVIGLLKVRSQYVIDFLTNEIEPTQLPNESKLSELTRNFCSLLTSCHDGFTQLSELANGRYWRDVTEIQKELSDKIIAFIQKSMRSGSKSHLFHESWKGKCLYRLKTINERLPSELRCLKFEKLQQEIVTQQNLHKTAIHKELEELISREHFTENDIKVLVSEAGSKENLYFIRKKLKIKTSNLKNKFSEFDRNLKFQVHSSKDLYDKVLEFSRDIYTKKALEQASSVLKDKIDSEIDFSRVEELEKVLMRRFLEQTVAEYVNLAGSIFVFKCSCEQIKTINKLIRLMQNIDQTIAANLSSQISKALIASYKDESVWLCKVSQDNFKPYGALDALWNDAKKKAEDKYKSLESLDCSFASYYKIFIVSDEQATGNFDEIISEDVKSRLERLSRLFQEDWEQYTEEKKKLQTLLLALPQALMTKYRTKTEEQCNPLEQKERESIEKVKDELNKNGTFAPFFKKFLYLEKIKWVRAFKDLRICFQEWCRDSITVDMSDMTLVLEVVRNKLRPIVNFMSQASMSPQSELNGLIQSFRSAWVNTLFEQLAETIKKFDEVRPEESSAKESIGDQLSGQLLRKIQMTYNFLIGEGRSVFTNEHVAYINNRLAAIITRSSFKAEIVLTRIESDNLNGLISERQIKSLLKVMNECLHVLQEAERLYDSYCKVNPELQELIDKNQTSPMSVRKLFELKKHKISEYMSQMASKVNEFSFQKLQIQTKGKEAVLQEIIKIEANCELLLAFDSCAAAFQGLNMSSVSAAIIMARISDSAVSLLEAGINELETKFSSVTEEPSAIHNEIILLIRFIKDRNVGAIKIPKLAEGLKEYEINFEKARTNFKEMMEKETACLIDIVKTTIIDDQKSESIKQRHHKTHEDQKVSIRNAHLKKLELALVQINQQNITKQEKTNKINTFKCSLKEEENSQEEQANKKYQEKMNFEQERMAKNRNERQKVALQCLKAIAALFKMSLLDLSIEKQFKSGIEMLNNLKNSQAKVALREQSKALMAIPIVRQQLISRLPFLVEAQKPLERIYVPEQKNATSVPLIQKSEDSTFDIEGSQGLQLNQRAKNVQQIIQTTLNRLKETDIDIKIKQIAEMCQQLGKYCTQLEQGKVKLLKEPKQRIIGFLFAIWCLLNPVSTQRGLSFKYQPRQCQILSALLLVHCEMVPAQPITRRIVELASGEGKSLVGAIVNCYLALTSHQVYYICSGTYVAQHQETFFSRLYQQLGITSKISYMTTQEFCTIMTNNFCDIQTLEGMHKYLKTGSYEQFPKAWQGPCNQLQARLNNMVIIMDESRLLFNPKQVAFVGSQNLQFKSTKMPHLFKSISSQKYDLGVLESFIKGYPLIEQILRDQIKCVLGARNSKENQMSEKQKKYHKMIANIAHNGQVGNERLFLKIAELGFYNMCRSVKCLLGLSSNFMKQPKELCQSLCKDLNLQALSVPTNNQNSYLNELPPFYCRNTDLAGTLMKEQNEVRKQNPGRPILILFVEQKDLDYFAKTVEYSAKQGLPGFYILRKASPFNVQKSILDVVTYQNRTTVMRMKDTFGVDLGIKSKQVQDYGGPYIILAGSFVEKPDYFDLKCKFSQKASQATLRYLHILRTQQQFKLVQENSFSLKEYITIWQEEREKELIKLTPVLIAQARKRHKGTIEAYQSKQMSKIIELMKSLNEYKFLTHRKYIFVIEPSPMLEKFHKYLYDYLVEPLISLSYDQRVQIQIKFIYFVNQRETKSFVQTITEHSETIKETEWLEPHCIDKERIANELKNFKNVDGRFLSTCLEQVIQSAKKHESHEVYMLLSDYSLIANRYNSLVQDNIKQLMETKSIAVFGGWSVYPTGSLIPQANTQKGLESIGMKLFNLTTENLQKISEIMGKNIHINQQRH